MQLLQQNPRTEFKSLKHYLYFQFDYNAFQQGIKNKDDTTIQLNEYVFNNKLGDNESVDTKDLID